MRTLIRLADAQADLSLRWAHKPSCSFCHKMAHYVSCNMKVVSISSLRCRFNFCRNNRLGRFHWVFPFCLLPFHLLSFCLLPFCLHLFHLLSNFTSYPFHLHLIFVPFTSCFWWSSCIKNVQWFALLYDYLWTNICHKSGHKSWVYYNFVGFSFFVNGVQA